MELTELETKVKGWFSKSAKVSKQALEKAGDKVQDFTDKSVLKVEKKQLESKRERLYTDLGKKVSEMIAAGAVINSENEDDKKSVEDIQGEIIAATEQIAAKEKEIAE